MTETEYIEHELAAEMKELPVEVMKLIPGGSAIERLMWLKKAKSIGLVKSKDNNHESEVTTDENHSEWLQLYTDTTEEPAEVSETPKAEYADYSGMTGDAKKDSDVWQTLYNKTPEKAS